jgi:diadenosine tetraphosphatase ApaH/serine/threonine PP2A family protein phosphatase
VRYLILSDVHANLEALDAVLEDAAGQWDRVVILGDLVGYGADPNAVIERLRALDPFVVIRGNHDKASCGIDSGENFNQVARYAAAWTHDRLTPAHRDYLRQLPAGPAPIDARLEICHGAPFDEDHYIFDAGDAQRSFEATSRPTCLFGHTHLPVVFAAAAAQLSAEVPDGEPRTLPLDADVRYLVNVGSVGQPRDGDPRAAYGFYVDEGTIEFRRVYYDIAGAQRKITAAGLPQTLAHRLAMGR